MMAAPSESTGSSASADIQGTYVFDSRRAVQGYPLNAMCMSLNDAANRELFRSAPDTYMARYDLSAAQSHAVRRRAWIEMLELGGNIYFIGKLALIDGLSMYQLGALMTDIPLADFTALMQQGGRQPNG